MASPRKLNLAKDLYEIQNSEDYGPLSRDKVAELYSSIAHLMSDEHREYLNAVLNGGTEVDALLELEMFTRLVTVYGMQSVMKALEAGTVTKDIGILLGEVRQGTTAIENMRTKRIEKKEATRDAETDEGMAGPSRESALFFLEGLDTEPSS